MEGYKVRYRLEFVDVLKRLKRVDVLQQAYVGDYYYEFYDHDDLQELIGASSPLVIGLQNSGDEKYESIKSTYIEFSFQSLKRFVFTEEFSQATDRDFIIRVEEAESIHDPLILKHIGFVIPQIYSEPYIKAPYPVTITATSLGLLNHIRYKPDLSDYGEYGHEYLGEYGTAFYQGEVSLMTVLTRCLGKLGFGLEIWDSINTRETRQAIGPDLSALTETYIDQSAFIFEDRGRIKAKYCAEVLEDILKPFVVNFFQDYGRWVIIPIEERADQRIVRKYKETGDYLETIFHNPFEDKPQWIEYDQQLEFKPVLHDVESMHDHGLPENLIKNYDFNGGFEEFYKSGDPFGGMLYWPRHWQLSDIDHFEAALLFRSIREVVATDEYGPSALQLVSSGIDDNGYVSFIGDRVVEANGLNLVHFSMRYTARVAENILGGAQWAPDKTADIRFVIKLHTLSNEYYLNDEGGWVETPTELIKNVMGDGSPGYRLDLLSPAPPFPATNFQEFEFVSEPIPESGTIEVQILKPISEDEGSSPGDTFVVIALSKFSLEIFPDGLPPEDSSTFFAERDVDIYSEPATYDLALGDGPTTFHNKSLLIIDEYGRFVTTQNWERNEFAGGIADIIINIIFQEYWHQSWMIRGTQKVRALFDRWFAEFGRAYVPNSGEYDERFCQFNGEVIQNLSGGGPADPGDIDETFDVLVMYQKQISICETQYKTARAIDGEISQIQGPYHGIPDSHIDFNDGQPAGREQTASAENDSDGNLHFAHRYSNDDLVYQMLSVGGDWSLPYKFGESEDFKYIAIQTHGGNVYILYIDLTTGMPRIWNKNQDSTINVPLPGGASTIRTWGYSSDRNFIILPNGSMRFAFYSDEVGLIVFRSDNFGASWSHEILPAVNACDHIQVNYDMFNQIVITYKDITDNSIKQIQSSTWSGATPPTLIKSNAEFTESLSYFIDKIDNMHYMYFVNYGTGWLEFWARSGFEATWLQNPQRAAWPMNYPSGKFFALIVDGVGTWFTWVTEQLENAISLYPSAPLVGITPAGYVPTDFAPPTTTNATHIGGGDIELTWGGGGPEFDIYVAPASTQIFEKHNTEPVTSQPYLFDDLESGVWLFRVHSVEGDRVSAPGPVVYASNWEADLEFGTIYFIGRWRDPNDDYEVDGVGLGKLEYSMSDIFNPNTMSRDNFTVKSLKHDYNLTDVFHTREDTKSFYMIRLKGGNIVAAAQGDTGSAGRWTSLLVVDENLNYIAHDRVDFDGGGWLTSHATRSAHVLSSDEQGNIYYVRPISNPQAPNLHEFKVFKYDSELNQIWESDFLPYFTGLPGSTLWSVYVGKNNVLVHRNLDPGTHYDAPRAFYIIRKSDGKLLEEKSSIEHFGNRTKFCAIPDGRFCVVRYSTPQEPYGSIFILDEFGNVLEKKSFDEISGIFHGGTHEARIWATWDPFLEAVLVADDHTNGHQWIDIDNWEIIHQVVYGTNQPYAARPSFIDIANAEIMSCRELDSAFQGPDGSIGPTNSNAFSHVGFASTDPLGGTNARYNPMPGGSNTWSPFQNELPLADNRYMTSDYENWQLEGFPPVPQPAAPPQVQGLLFNGADQYVETGFDFSENGNYFGDFTIEFRFRSTAENMASICGFNNGGSPEQLFDVLINTDRNFNHQPRSIAYQMRDSDNRPNRAMALADFYDNVFDFHVAITKEEGTPLQLFYINGWPILRYWGSGWNWSSEKFDNIIHKLFIGARNNQGTPEAFFQGRIQDFRIWKAVRTAEEIKDNWRDPLNANDWQAEYPDLILYYKMNEGSGNILTDETGNYPGTLIGNINDNMWG